MLAVGAVSETNNRSSFSNTGRHIGLVAPGSNILSTLPTQRSAYRADTAYASWSGTSMATPHVAAAAGLLMAKRPNSKPADVKARLRKTAHKLPGMKGRDWTQEYGDGLLDVKRALS